MSAGGGLTVGHLVRLGAAMATAGAGLIHLDTAGDHTAHPHLAAFFVLLGGAQLAAAGLLVARPGRVLQRAVVAGTAGVILLWLVTRTTGLPFVPDLRAAEPVGLPDAVATALEGVTLVALGLLAALPRAAMVGVVAAADRARAGMAAAALVVTAPALIVGPGHVHDGDHPAEHQTATGADGDHHGAVSADDAVGDRHAHTAGVVAAGHEAGADGHAGAATDAGPHHALPAVGTGGAGHAHDATHDRGTSPGADPAHATASHTVPGVAAEGIDATVRYGPFTLPPASSDGVRSQNGLLTNVVLTNLARPCDDCFLTMMEPNLVHADGREANYDTGAMLHHTVLAQSWYEDPTCDRNSTIGFAGRRFFASGNERTGAAFPSGYGVFIDDTPWTGIFEIMNHRDVPQTVYFQFHVRYVPAGAAQTKPLTPLWLDVDNCGDSQFAVPAGRTVTDWDWTSSITGRVVLTAGHVHDGGVSITLSNATTRQSLCRSVAGYGTKPAFMGAIDSMSVCGWDRVGTVRAGETLRISALYDTPEALPDVMGIILAFVFETEDLEGGTDAPHEMTHPPEGGTPPPPGHGHGH
jgi:hypothetical protein